MSCGFFPLPTISGWCLRCPDHSFSLLSTAGVMGRTQSLYYIPVRYPVLIPVLFQVLGMMKTLRSGRVTQGWPTTSISRYSFSEWVSGRVKAVVGTGGLFCTALPDPQPSLLRSEWESLVGDGTLPSILAQWTIRFLTCLPLDMLAGG